MKTNSERIFDIVTSCDEYYEDFMGAINPPTFETSVYRFPDWKTCEEVNAGKYFRYCYGKNANPTLDVVCAKLAAMERGEAAKCFSSGTAAMYTALMRFLSSGDHVVTIDHVYGRIRNFLNDTFPRYGIAASFVDGTDPESFRTAIRPNTKVFYLESPSTWQFDLQDLETVIGIAKDHGIITIIDNTWATPVFQNPIDFGADIVVHSASKYLGGHSDLVAGVMVSSEEIINTLPEFGSVLSPYEANKLLRGLRTLPLRMERHQKNALEVATYLEKSGKVEEVIYPGLKSNPQYQLVKKQMHGTSGLMSFVPACDAAGLRRFMNALRHISITGSWGGYESVIYSVNPDADAETLYQGGLKPKQVRLSVGLENPDILLEDLERGLKAI